MLDRETLVEFVGNVVVMELEAGAVVSEAAATRGGVIQNQISSIPLTREDVLVAAVYSISLKRLLEHACANGWALLALWTRKRATDSVPAFR